MLFMNESEIDMYRERYSHHPVLGKATKILSEFRHLVNENSDGWAYWRAPLKAAVKLMNLIYHPDGNNIIDEASLKAALIPIKSFCTRKKLKFDLTVVLN